MGICCQQDDRRDAVRRMDDRNGLDYVEVSDDQRTLTAYFLGKLPPELQHAAPGHCPYLKIDGGQRVTDIQIVAVDAVVDPDPEKDDFVVVKLDKFGDFSTYTLRLTGLANIDPRYDHVDFSFKVNCPSDLDCAPSCACEPSVLPEPEINYLAKDYGSFRQQLLDRLAVLMPDWHERHVADVGVMLVEILAYAGDYLSYYQDAVATEAYLETARQRISVRRHARLVDYFLHEGCNARAWVCFAVSNDVELDPQSIACITGLNNALAAQQSVLTWDALADTPAHAYDVFEPLVVDRAKPIALRVAHNEIHFHTWGEKRCCLERGSTSATLLDRWAASRETGKAAVQGAAERALRLQAGDVLIFEEVLGPHTGLSADADPMRRHAVRLTKTSTGEDPVGGIGGSPIPYVRVEWAPEDALPFPLCLSAIGDAPSCRYIDNVSVARGNVVLMDHGRTQDADRLGEVPATRTDAVCECANEPGEVQVIPGRFRSTLRKVPLTFSEPLAIGHTAQPIAAAALLNQDVRLAAPQVWLTSEPAWEWVVRRDLIDSGPSDTHFVVEIDNDQVAHLRFGDGELGNQPPAGMTFSATYRVGNGAAGNVGADAISRLVLKSTGLSGVSIAVRNPLAARGGSEPEPLAEAKLFAPHLFRKRIERAVVAGDYEDIAERNQNIQMASAALEWTGSWYEAHVAIDPLGREDADPRLLADIARDLSRFRRVGHDLAVVRATYVPVVLRLDVCALAQYERAHVKAALLDAFSIRALPGGRRGFFHPDNLTFGEGIYLSQIIAAGQRVAGVECVEVVAFHRLFDAPNHEIENGVLPLAPWEIAQLDNDPNVPERGLLDIRIAGGL